MIEIIPATPDSLVFASATGKVTGEDYEKVLMPAIDAKLKTHKKIRLLYHLGKEFSGFTAGAIWDDAKVGFTHLTGFEAIAVVTDVLWIADSVKFLGVFMRCPVKAFSNDELDEARNWVATTTWRSVSEVETE